MNRKKFNIQFDNQTMHQKSYVWLLLHDEIEFILSPTIESFNELLLNDVYIHNDDIESQLNSYLTSTGYNKLVFLTGLTGCGKSCLLKYIFGEKHIRIVDNSLIIMFQFDNKTPFHNNQNILEYFVGMIAHACRELTRVFSIPEIDANDRENSFIRYIEAVRPDLLEINSGWENVSNEDRLHNLYEKYPLEFNMLKLKYFLNSDGCNIKTVVIVVDDIESVGPPRELLPIGIALTMKSCFENGIPYKAKKWCVNFIISCRHYVYRMLKTRNIDPDYVECSHFNSQTIESYAIDNEIHIDTPPDMLEIIKKRYDTIMRDNTSKSEKWKLSMGVIMNLIGFFDTSCVEFITDLNLNNIRKSLECLKRLVFNRRWIQRDNVVHGAVAGSFSIEDLKNFNLAPPIILRAIGMEESNMYSGHDSIIPNLLFNEQVKGMDLMVLMALKCFILRSDATETNWKNDIKISNVYESVSAIFSKEFMSGFRKAVEYLIINRLLLRSKNQSQDDGIDLSPEIARKVESVYLSKAATDLWNMLKTSSVLFEMYVDDIWIQSSIRHEPKKNIIMFDNSNYKECL